MSAVDSTRAVYCFWLAPRSDLVNPKSSCQADTPHLAAFALKCDKCSLANVKKNGVREYFGKWQDSYVSVDPSAQAQICTAPPTLPDECRMPDRIESWLTCEKPHWFNSGPHRLPIIAWFGSARIVFASEEAQESFTENLFIGAFEVKEFITNEVAEELFVSAFFAKTHTVLNPEYHKFIVYRKNNPSELVAQECKPSEHMYDK